MRAPNQVWCNGEDVAERQYHKSGNVSGEKSSKGHARRVIDEVHGNISQIHHFAASPP